MSEELWCTECPYFRYVADDMDDSWYGTKCDKDGHEANPSMYAVQSLHDDCPLNRGRKMTIHELKISPKYFEDVDTNKKRFELRKDDRDYQVGDLIALKEYENGEYTGREIKYIPIVYILRDVPEYGLKEGYCILGF